MNPPTVKVTVTPVTNGAPNPGYTIKDETDWPPVGCTASPFTVSTDMHFCGASADDLPACWKSTGDTVLCLRSALVKQLVRRHTFSIASGAGGNRPLTVALTSGVTCTAATGGAWTRVDGHPELVGYGSCSDGKSVYAPLHTDGYDHATAHWSATLVLGTHIVGTGYVKTAYYAG